jgi:RND family efflux transporter MFP subunit
MASTSKKALPFTLIAAFAIIASLAWFFHFGLPEAQVAKVISDTAINAVSGTLIVKAERDKDVFSETTGVVAESTLELNKHVKEDDLLVRIDSTDLLLEIDRVQSQYDAAKKTYAAGSNAALELDAAKDAYENAERQRKVGQISDADLLAQKRKLQASEQNFNVEQIARTLALANFENSLKSMHRQLEKMTIKAPFDGIVTRVDARKKDLIAKDAPVAHLIATGRLVEARLSEENIASVKVGQKAFVTFLSYGMKQFNAKVVLKMSSADPETQRYPVHLEVENIEPEKLTPGITGEVSIIIDSRPAKALVPRPAVFSGKVFVVKDGKIEIRNVKTGYESVTAIEILEGLAPGELVIVSKLDEFNDGKRVKPVLIDDPRWR